MKKENKKDQKKTNGHDVSEPQTPKLKPVLKELRLTEKGCMTLLQNVRLAFVSVDKPNTRFGTKDATGQAIDGNYEVTCLIPKSEVKFPAVLNKLIEQTLKNNSNLKTAQDKEKAYKIATKIGAEGGLLKDGDELRNKDGVVYDGLEGHYALKVKTKAILNSSGGFSPRMAFKIVDKNKNTIRAHEIADRVYSGVWADVALTFSPYKSGINMGVTTYLSGIQVLFDDTRLGGSDPFTVREDIESSVGFYSGADEEVAF